MSNDAEKSDRVAYLEEQKKVIEKWFDNPITKEILLDLSSQQEDFLYIILENDITSLETFFLHFTACGHLRGLRRFKSLAELKLEEVKEELKQENNE